MGKIKGSAKCPNCGNGADGYTEAVVMPGGKLPEFTPPVTGSVSICAYCGCIGLYDVKKDGTTIIRKPTEKELEDVIKEIPDLKLMVQGVKNLRNEYLKKNN